MSRARLDGMTRWFVAALGMLGLSALSCSADSDATACNPGERVACACPGGQLGGQQVCASNGSSFGACEGCGAAGSGGSGATGGSSGGSGTGGTGGDGSWPEYSSNPYVFELDFEVPPVTAQGSIFAHELDGDGLMDFVVTATGNVAAYDHWGGLLWREQVAIRLSDSANGGYGFPGRHAPGAIAGDMDGDGQAEVAYLTESGRLRIHDGKTGALKSEAHEFPGAEAIAIANFRGLGDRDALVQYSQWELRAISLEDGQTLWHTQTWEGIEHSAVRVADVDGDGRDDVVGPNFLGPDGVRLNGWDLAQQRGTHYDGLDSLAIGDIVPGGPLEVAVAETAPDKSGIGIMSGETIVTNPDAIVWATIRPSEDIPPTGQCATEKDPDKLAIGDFDSSRPGLEVFARSACANHPWLMDATGAIFASWNVADTAPAGWFLGGPPVEGSEGGIDVVTPIRWQSGDQQQLLLKERHLDRMAAIVSATDGVFMKVFDVTAARSYAADVAGDHREEAIIVEARTGQNGRVLIFWNDAPSSETRERPWAAQHYRRIKQNYNYYSP
jgi:hypothetical protein